MLPVVTEVAQLFPSDFSDSLGQGFGLNAAIDGDWIAVGAFDDSEAEYRAGAVYLFRRNGTRWVEHSKIRPIEGTWEGHFGVSVDLNSDRLVVVQLSTPSAPAPGLARLGYVYRRNNGGTPRDLTDDEWELETTLNAPLNPNPNCCSRAGSAHIDRNIIVIGKKTNEFSVGTVSVFELTDGQWKYLAELVGGDSMPGDLFGSPVSVSDNGSHLAIGAVRAKEGAGAVYFFRKIRGEWVEESMLESFGSVWQFGNALSMDGIFLAVSSHSATGGLVDVYRRSGRNWIHENRLASPEGIYDFVFGNSVFVAGSDLFIWTREQPSEFWVIHRYHRIGNRWELREKLVAEDTGTSQGYSGILDKSGRYFVAGGAGTAYVLRTVP